MNPVLYIFSGLPGSGKSTLAMKLAKKTKASYFRIDTIEQGIRDLCSFNVQGEGYRLTYKIVEDNLKIGNNVVSDSCNPLNITRNEWEDVAKKCNANYVNIEVICTNTIDHKDRIKNRISEIDGIKLPDWQEIQNRDYDVWIKPHITIDTANRSVDESINELYEKLEIIKFDY